MSAQGKSEVGSFLTSPCKGEVGGGAAGRGYSSRFSRTKIMTKRARHLRHTTTDAEAKLWKALRRDQFEGLHFRRQHPLGAFVLDFFCPSLRLAIELDGGQHNTTPAQAADKTRTRWLNEHGVVVVRYWNNEVLGNFVGVLEDLMRVVADRRSLMTPAPPLPLSGGGSTGNQP